MPTRKAEARWTGDLRTGKGTMKLGSGAFQGAFTFASRFENGTGTNPEELIGAAHAGCYSMALSNVLAEAGYNPKSVEASAEVTFGITDDGPTITGIFLICKANIPGIKNPAFQRLAEMARKGCPVSKALAGVKLS